MGNADGTCGEVGRSVQAHAVVEQEQGRGQHFATTFTLLAHMGMAIIQCLAVSTTVVFSLAIQ